MGFRQDRQQRVMAGASMLTRVVALERTFPPAVALEEGRIQIQAVAFGAHGQALDLPLDQRSEQALDIAHAEAPEEIADRVVGREPGQSEHGVKGAVATQQVGVGEALGAHQHGDQERGERRRWVDLIGRVPLDWHVLAEFAGQADPAQIGDEHRDAAEGRHRPLRLTQNQPLAGQ